MAKIIHLRKLIFLITICNLAGCTSSFAQERTKEIFEIPLNDFPAVQENYSLQKSSLSKIQQKDTLFKFYEQSVYVPSDILMLEFNEPHQQNASKFQQITGKTIYCYNAADSSNASGFSYVLVFEDEWEKVFELELRITTTIGAGNRIGTDSNSREIKNKDKLKQEIKPLLKDFYIQNDPKFLVYDKASPDSCTEYFK